MLSYFKHTKKEEKRPNPYAQKNQNQVNSMGSSTTGRGGSLLDSEKKTLEFANHLVISVFGQDIFDFPEAQRSAVVKEVLEGFINYILEYTKINFGNQAYHQLRDSLENIKDLPFEDTKFRQNFENAYQAWLKLVENNLAINKV